MTSPHLCVAADLPSRVYPTGVLPVVMLGLVTLMGAPAAIAFALWTPGLACFQNGAAYNLQVTMVAAHWLVKALATDLGPARVLISSGGTLSF